MSAKTELFLSGKLDRRMLGEWVKQHYHYVSHFSEWLGVVYSNCPQPEVQHFLLENIAEEEGLLGMGEFGAVRHTDLLLDFAEHCGVKRAEILNAQLNGEVLAETLGLQSWCYRQVSRPFVEALSGLIIGLEAQVPVIYRRTTPALIEKYGFTPEQITSSGCASSPTTSTASAASRSSSATRRPRKRARTACVS